MVGWRFLSYAIKKGLEKFGFTFESADYKNLRCGIFFGAVQAGVSLPDADNIDPSASGSRGLRSIAYLHGFDGTYWARCRVDSAYWLKARVKHSLEHKLLALDNQTVDPGTTVTLLDISGQGVVRDLYVRCSGVHEDHVAIGVVADNEVALADTSSTAYIAARWGLDSPGEAFVPRIRLITRDNTNYVYHWVIDFQREFLSSLTVKAENKHDTGTLTVKYIRLHYLLVAGSSRLKFTLEKDIGELDPTLVALECEDVLGLTRESPRPLITTILAKESLEEGQPAVNTMELILDRDYDDASLEGLISYVERKYKAKLIARW